MKKFLSKLLGGASATDLPAERNGWHTLYKMPEFLRLIRIERDRVHRNDMFFTLILFKVNSNESENGFCKRLVERLRKRVRKIDQIGWYDDEHIGVLLPETPPSGAQIVIRDIFNAEDGVDIPFEVETITYPESDEKLKRREING